MLIDSHAHLNTFSLAEQRDFLKKAEKAFKYIIDVSIDYESSLRSLELSRKYPFIFSALGFHPYSISHFNHRTISLYKKLIEENNKVIAIGEIGLDFKAKDSLEKQVFVLKQFLFLAKEYKLTIVIHNRLDSYKALEVLNECLKGYNKVVFHCFSQDSSFVRKVLDRGWFISFALNVLRKKLDKVVQYVPKESILVETDSPYMKVRGKLSSPFNIEELLNYIAGLKNISYTDLLKIVEGNFEKVFLLKS